MAELLKVLAPFSDDQVRSLNDYQVSGVFHPFTCSKRDRPGHEHPVDNGLLIAHKNGWYCSAQGCDYVQLWAHAWMADDSWRVVQESYRKIGLIDR